MKSVPISFFSSKWHANSLTLINCFSLKGIVYLPISQFFSFNNTFRAIILLVRSALYKTENEVLLLLVVSLTNVAALINHADTV